MNVASIGGNAVFTSGNVNRVSLDDEALSFAKVLRSVGEEKTSPIKASEYDSCLLCGSIIGEEGCCPLCEGAALTEKGASIEINGCENVLTEAENVQEAQLSDGCFECEKRYECARFMEKEDVNNSVNSFSFDKADFGKIPEIKLEEPFTAILSNPFFFDYNNGAYGAFRKPEFEEV